MPLSCRFYERELPQAPDAVMVHVRSVAPEAGARVQLLEYDRAEGFIQPTELSRRRLRCPGRQIRVGGNEVALVIGVDAASGAVELSKRRVSLEDAEKCAERYARSKAVNQILRRVAERLGYCRAQLLLLCSRTAWHFDSKRGRPGASYDAFKQFASCPELLDECRLDADARAALLDVVGRRLAPRPLRIRAEFEATCFGFQGVVGVKAALRAGVACASDEFPLRIRLVAPPEFAASADVLDERDGLDRMRAALDAVADEIRRQGGAFRLRRPPRATTGAEEARHLHRLDELLFANREVSADEEEADEQDGWLPAAAAAAAGAWVSETAGGHGANGDC